MGLFDRVEVFALQILDKRKFQNLAVACFAENCRRLDKTDLPRRAPAPFYGDQLELLTDFADDQRLDDAALPD